MTNHIVLVIACMLAFPGLSDAQELISPVPGVTTLFEFFDQHLKR